MNKVMIRIKVFVLVFFMSVAFENIIAEDNLSFRSMTLTENGTVANENIDVTSLNNEFASYKTDRGYKLWYGTWIVEKKVGEKYNSNSQDIREVIGKTYRFSRKKAIICIKSLELYMEYPEYRTTIIPLDEKTTYIPNMQPTLTELGLTGKYVVIFSVRGYDAHFFIKDDETLIMYYRDTYFELHRLEHEDGYTAFYTAL